MLEKMESFDLDVLIENFNSNTRGEVVVKWDILTLKDGFAIVYETQENTSM